MAIWGFIQRQKMLIYSHGSLWRNWGLGNLNIKRNPIPGRLISATMMGVQNRTVLDKFCICNRSQLCGEDMTTCHGQMMRGRNVPTLSGRTKCNPGLINRENVPVPTKWETWRKFSASAWIGNNSFYLLFSQLSTVILLVVSLSGHLPFQDFSLEERVNLYLHLWFPANSI